MVHPTCALARPPHAPPADDKPRLNLATLTQVVGEINVLTDAYRAAACINNLVASARSARIDECLSHSRDLRALMTLVNAEFELRAQRAKEAIASMHEP